MTNGDAAPADVRRFDSPPLSVRADVGPGTVNDEDRSVELIITTGAAVQRQDWMTGKAFLEVLSLDPAHVRMGRLNEGVPLLDSHSAWSVSDILGTTIPGTARLSKKDIRVRARFSKRAEVDPVWQDVRDGIVRSVSIGYRVYKVEEEEPSKKSALPVRRAIDWEPFETSMVPIPADAGAMARGAKPVDTNPCEIVAAQSAPALEERMEPKNETAPEFIAEQPAIQPAAPAAQPATPSEADQARAAERVRVQGIMNACRTARLPQAFQDKLIADGLSLVEAQTRVFGELAVRNAQDVGPGPVPAGARFEVGDDPLVHERAGIEEALLHRMYPEQVITTVERTPEGKRQVTKTVGFKLTDRGRTYRGMRMLDVARAFLTARGMRVTMLSPMELAGVALNLRGAGLAGHTTSDFANLLADLPGKILRQAYQEAPQTFGPFVRRTTLADFKPSRLLQLGEAPALLEVGEHGEFEQGTIGESKEQYQLKTYGRKFAITRQALINDDLDAFSRVPMAFGRQARNKESDLVWAEITANAAMGDGVALFHATHGNLAGAGAVISVATIGAGRSAMRQQKGIDGATFLNVSPAYLIVPTAIETTADQFVSQNMLASQPSNVNPFAGKLIVVAEPRLDANSATAYYLAATPDQIDIIVLGTLDGENGPMVESRVGFDVDGIEVKVRHDIAAKVVDYRGLYKNPGA